MSLAVKIATGLVLLALLSLSLPGYLLWLSVSDRMGELEELAAAELHAGLKRRVTELERSVGETVARIAAETATDADFLAAVWAAPAPPRSIAERATSLLAQTDLDLLWLIDADGVIVSCGHWPARAGADGRRFADRPLGRPHAARERVRNDTWLSLLVKERIPVGERVLWVVGGRRLDEAVRTATDVSGSGLLLMNGGGEVVAARPWPPAVSVPPTTWLATAIGGEPFAAEVAADSGEAHLVAATPLLGDGAVQGILVATRSLAPLRAWRTRFLATLGGVSVAAVVLAAVAGLFLGRRIAGPVQELTRVSGRVAAGELDLSLPVRSRDEVGRLTEAFNTMAASIRSGRRDLARSERLAAWRDAARRMAHEVKNPLAPIRMSVENLRRAREVSGETFDSLFREECETILEEVDALRRLVDEFSRFARLPEPLRRPSEPAALVRHAVDLYASSRDGVDLDLDVEEGLPSLDVDPDLIGQVLKNLLANALDAVPDGSGRIQVRCESRNGEVVFSVHDNGPGVPEEVRDRLFEPQVSTKATGSGLGLAISRQIIERHGGRMEVATGSTGSVFRFILPIEAGD